SPTSGGYFNNLGRLRSCGLIDYPEPGLVALTNAGRAAAHLPDEKCPPIFGQCCKVGSALIRNPYERWLKEETFPRSLRQRQRWRRSAATGRWLNSPLDTRYTRT